MIAVKTGVVAAAGLSVMQSVLKPADGALSVCQRHNSAVHYSLTELSCVINFAWRFRHYCFCTIHFKLKRRPHHTLTDLFLMDESPHTHNGLLFFPVDSFLPVSLSGSHTARRRDPVRSAATRLPAGLPTSGETQDRPHLLHD